MKSSSRYTAAAPRRSHFASRTSAASLAGSGTLPLLIFSFGAAGKLLRQHDGVAQHDVGAAHLDIAAGLQVFHDAAHHLAGSADHLGDVLLRQALGDDLLAVDVFGHVEEEARHASVDIQEREAADLAIGLAQALD